MEEFAWDPTPKRIAEANVTRLMARAGSGSIDELRRQSVADVDWFWDLVVSDLGIAFHEPYSTVHDSAGGAAWTRWFVGGRLNVTDAALDRWARDPERADTSALEYEGEDGTRRRLSFRELAAEVDALAAGLRARGVERGDAVAVHLPAIVEAVVAAYAVAKIGALFVPLRVGATAAQLAVRLDDAQAEVVITTDWRWRHGRQVPLKADLDEAVVLCDVVETVVVVERPETTIPTLRRARDTTWSAVLDHAAGPQEAEWMGEEDRLMLAYTAGATGPPKGAVHTHAGFLVKAASELAYGFDVRPGDVVLWAADPGSLMGPLSTVGTHAAGGTLLLYEGSITEPSADRLWALVADHEVAVVGVSPAMTRALRAHGDDAPAAHDLGSVRVWGSTGEPWDEDSYRWLSSTVGLLRAPVINVSGGAEVGGSFLSPYVVERIRPCSLGGPSLGMEVDVFDAEGRPVRGQLGELVCRQPWPSMPRGLWGDPDGYRATYWSMYPEVWRQGDWAKADLDGEWYLLGRSDEAIGVEGKRVGPAEVEGVVLSHAAVAEVAVIGVPDARRGEAIWCWWSPVDPAAPDESDALAALVEHELGPAFAPARVIRVDELPRTRTGKVMRRAIRSVAGGGSPGDLTTAVNPGAFDQIAAVSRVAQRPAVA
ncbi:AMP-binding protein [Patulibacter minatonensis]|uniref:AMP-binding protein n=1 Tax=Patulibacter minatonensis TaxID=298163 RepID=UPI0004787E7F|nr:AMP-binding protein [Patulibacter minatonensis]